MSNGTYEQQDFAAFVASLGGDPDALALITEAGERITRGALRQNLGAWEPVARGCGLTPAHRLATVLPGGSESATALLALIGVVNLMPLNPQAQPSALADQIAASDADAVLLPAGPDGDALSTLLHKRGVPALRWVPGTAPALTGGPVGPARSARQPGLVLHTSGSTGVPKRVPLTPGQLVLSAQNIAAHLALGPHDRVAHALPLFHVGAIVDLLLAPLLSGGSVAFGRDLSAEAVADVVTTHAATWAQLVPTALAHLIHSAAPETGKAMAKSLRFVRMVSADLPEALRLEGEAFFPGTPLIQMYGMTETSGQIASMPLPPAPRLPQSVGRVVGPEVALIDAQGALVAPGRSGEICVRGPTVMAGYEGTAPTPRHGDWLRTGDLGRFGDDGTLFLVGRVKEVINRGGEKISPLVVERAARAVDGVREAVAFARPHPTLGEQVGLAVVADDGLGEADILAGLRPRLAAFEMPRHITRLAELPRLPGGKVDRRKVAEIGRGDEAGPAAPASPLAATVSRIWAETLNIRPPHAEADFFDDGGDSLSATDFLTRLERALRRPLPPNLLFEAPTFAALVAALEATPNSPATSDEPPYLTFLRQRTAGWQGQRVGPHQVIVARNTVRESTKVFFAGNGLLAGQLFARHIASDHPVYLLRTAKDYAHTFRELIPQLAAFYADEICTQLAPGEPVILGGFCAGANLMEPLAPLLIARGHPVQLFVAIDKVFDAPTSYPVFYIGSLSPIYSIATRYLSPDRGFGDLHPAGAEVAQITGRHEHALKARNFKRLHDRLAPLLAGAPLAQTGASGLSFDARRKRYHARIKARLPRLMRTGQAANVPVTVTNTSGEVWPPYDESGIFLSAGAFSPTGAHLAERLDSHRLTHAVAPGESFEANLVLRWPIADRRRLWLSLHMVDDGFGWFDDFGTGSLRRLAIRLR